MTQAKHTPGPWIYDKTTCNIISQPSKITVVCVYGAMGGENTSADISLIAVAPELLDCLKLAVKVIQENKIASCAMFEMVIAKAEGRT